MTLEPRPYKAAPIIVGFAGIAGSGKTSTADLLAPTTMQFDISDRAKASITTRWDHISFALPLHQMAHARRGIEGHQAKDRMRYEIHATLLEIFGASPLYGAPPYNDLVEMVNLIASYPIEREGKPRTFLQEVGTNICKSYNSKCFINWVKHRAFDIYRTHLREWYDSQQIEEMEYDYDPPPIAVIVSDVRFPDEAEYIKSEPNGVLLKFDVDPDVAQARLLERDEMPLTNAQRSHVSETSVALIPEELFDVTIDTSSMTVLDQAELIKKTVNMIFGL